MAGAPQTTAPVQTSPAIPEPEPPAGGIILARVTGRPGSRETAVRGLAAGACQRVTAGVSALVG